MVNSFKKQLDVEKDKNHQITIQVLSRIICSLSSNAFPIDVNIDE